MEKEIEKIKQERDEYLDGWKRAKADFLNYKKDEDIRMESRALLARCMLLLDIFPILDNIERALGEIPEQDSQVYKGFLQIAKQWKQFLKSQGVEEIDAMGKPFDPEIHEAAEEIEGEKPGIVAEEVEKGYKIHNKVLRPSKVRVTK